MRHLKLAGMALAFATSAATSALAADKLPVVASFSILGNVVSEVGGDRIAVKTLVGPDGDAHVYQPTPADAATVTKASVVFVNGAEFEGWIERLIKASGYKGPIVTATKGIKLLETEEHHDDDHGKEEHKAEKGKKAGHDDHKDHKTAEKKEAGHDDHHHGEHDPHAWQDVKNVIVYAANVRDGLCKVDAAGCETYKKNAAAYTKKLEALDAEVRAQLSKIAAGKRTIITSHDAFGYFSKAYGVTVLAPQGLSTESEASAADVAKLIDQIRKDGIKAVFVENISDPRLIEQIAKETGAKIGGQLFSDALSKTSGPAGTYIKMMRHNASLMAGAMTGS
ncbi:MAG: metal ABC transporter substrate-binding protein [Pseudomonadota bacterium]